VTGEVPTSLPGVAFGGTFPRLAKLAHRMAVVRSFQHPVGDHEKAIVHVLTGGTDPAGRTKEGQSNGSVYAKLRGSNHPEKGTPTYGLLTDEEVDPQYRSERERVRRGSDAGALGAVAAPFEPGGKSQALADMNLRVTAERLEDRRDLLRELDRLERGIDQGGEGGTSTLPEVYPGFGSAQRAIGTKTTRSTRTSASANSMRSS
jgi:hypothetical protein